MTDPYQMTLSGVRAGQSNAAVEAGGGLTVPTTAISPPKYHFQLLLLAVAPGAQRRGVGAALLNHFIDQGRDRGVRRLHLEVRDGNPAVAMYQAFGFKAEGRRSKYYCGQDGSQHDALTMARAL